MWLHLAIKTVHAHGYDTANMSTLVSRPHGLLGPVLAARSCHRFPLNKKKNGRETIAPDEHIQPEPLHATCPQHPLGLAPQTLAQT